MNITIRAVTIEDYDGLLALWNSTEQSKRALNPVDDSREGICRYLKRNPTTCFAAVSKDGSGDADEIIGVILTGHDGRRAIIHHMCVHPAHRRDLRHRCVREGPGRLVPCERGAPAGNREDRRQVRAVQLRPGLRRLRG